MPIDVALGARQLAGIGGGAVILGLGGDGRRPSCARPSTIISPPRAANWSCKAPPVMLSSSATRRVRSTGPVSKPASMTIKLMPVSLSPAAIAR